MRSEKLTFTGAFGDELAARLDLPDAPPRAFALFAHCFTCGKDIFAASRIARELADRDIAVLRFDFTGLGHSDGEFANTNFSSNVDDLVAAADALRERFAAPTLLIGHSLGGAAVLTAAARVPELRAVATIGAPADPGHVAHLFEGARDEIEAAGEARSSWPAGRSASSSSSSTTSRPTARPSGSRSCAWRCWSCTRRSTPRWASTTPRRSSSRRATPRASSRSTPPTT